jgi:hypothetical protein
MFRVRTTAIAFCLVSLLSGPPVAAEDLQQLDFMSGAWGTDGIIVEYWLPPAAGRMIGIHHAAEGEKASFFEYLRIEAREDGIVYVASPMGTGTTDSPCSRISSTTSRRRSSTRSPAVGSKPRSEPCRMANGDRAPCV